MRSGSDVLRHPATIERSVFCWRAIGAGSSLRTNPFTWVESNQLRGRVGAAPHPVYSGPHWEKGAGFAYKRLLDFCYRSCYSLGPTPINLLKEEKSPSAKMGSFTKIIIASICVIFLAVKWTAPRFDEGKTERQPSAYRLVKHARTEKPVHMNLKCSRNTHWVLNSRVHSTCDIKEYILSSKTIRRKCVCGCGVPPRRTAF